MANQTDPFRNYKFEVEITGFVRAGFSKVSGLKHTVQVIDYREGGENETPHRLPGQSTFEPITFERGATMDTDFIAWMNQIFNIDNQNGGQPPNELFRKDLVIWLKDKAGHRVIQWTVKRAWPSERSFGDLDAGGNEVLIHSLVVQNEGIKEDILGEYIP